MIFLSLGLLILAIATWVAVDVVLMARSNRPNWRVRHSDNQRTQPMPLRLAQAYAKLIGGSVERT